MKIYIMTDMEGIAGVARWDQGDPSKPAYPQAVRIMTEELRACVQGIQDTDPQAEIWVLDAHGSGSVDYERFPRGAKLINRSRFLPPYFLDGSFDALFFVGQHARAGTPGANLAHTWSTTVAYCKINGVELGEFGCMAAMAGSYDVPTAFVSGDDKMMAEARALIPGIYGAQVKIGLGMETALHLAPEDARELVRNVADQATAHISNIEPFVLDGPPYEQEIKLCGGEADPIAYLERGFKQVDSLTFVKRADRMIDLKI